MLLVRWSLSATIRSSKQFGGDNDPLDPLWSELKKLGSSAAKKSTEKKVNPRLDQ